MIAERNEGCYKDLCDRMVVRVLSETSFLETAFVLDNLQISYFYTICAITVVMFKFFITNVFA